MFDSPVGKSPPGLAGWNFQSDGEAVPGLLGVAPDQRAVRAGHGSKLPGSCFSATRPETQAERDREKQPQASAHRPMMGVWVLRVARSGEGAVST